jgi:phage tail-like protein
MAFGASRYVQTKHKFLVQCKSNLTSAAFQSCSELSYEIAKIEYHEGGALIPIKTAGRMTFTDVTLSRGVSLNRDFDTWGKKVADASKNGNGLVGGLGLAYPGYKVDDVVIQEFNLDNSLKFEWTLFGAWPQKYVAGDWDNSVDEVVIEQLVLTYDFYKGQSVGAAAA